MRKNLEPRIVVYRGRYYVSYYRPNGERTRVALGTDSSGVFAPYPDDFGRGEWTAATMADARQMAGDFAEGVG